MHALSDVLNKPLKIALLLVGSMVIIPILAAVWICERLAAPTNELNQQLAEIIRTHDTDRMKVISVDKSTEQFLLGLPKDASVQAADFQGGGYPRPGVEIGGFPAAVGGRTVTCFMVLHTRIPSILPHWQLVKVSLEPVGIDPSWAGSATDFKHFYG